MRVMVRVGDAQERDEGRAEVPKQRLDGRRRVPEVGIAHHEHYADDVRRGGYDGQRHLRMQEGSNYLARRLANLALGQRPAYKGREPEQRVLLAAIECRDHISHWRSQRVYANMR